MPSPELLALVGLAGFGVGVPAAIAADYVINIRSAKKEIQRGQKELDKMGPHGTIIEVKPNPKNARDMLVTVEGGSGITATRSIRQELFDERGLTLGQEVEIRRRGTAGATLLPRK